MSKILVAMLTVVVFNTFSQMALPSAWAADCDPQVAIEATGAVPDNVKSTNPSGTPNGIQIWLYEPQEIYVPLEAEVIHHPVGDPYGIARPGELTPFVDVYTLYWKRPC